MGLCLTVELQRWAVEFRWELRRRDAADNKRDPACAISMDDEDPRVSDSRDDNTGVVSQHYENDRLQERRASLHLSTAGGVKE